MDSKVVRSGEKERMEERKKEERHSKATMEKKGGSLVLN